MSGSTQPAAGDFSTPAESNGITDLINNSSNTGREVAQTLASETLSRAIARGAGGLRGAAGGLAGALVQPAVWVLSGRAPQPGDIELWGLGTVVSLAGGAIGSGATMVTGLVKALVEDHEDGIIATAVANEPERYRPFIRSVRNYGASGRGIVAMTIANHGGVTWRVGPATWVYITDATGKLVCDYRPAHAMEIYAPVLPLRIVGRQYGEITYRWTTRNGNIHG
ncbi:hypothetical protein [Falsiroseomonas selenitidurans]|uniref:Uncharacterized protein n=1 Tax=Falsiroseomonas selenitidurans TaxID=2716335 RepID=A0ABX1E496_9PROT|nr:hypothetical protein [Falsiroseomonas selenitidurans]NKC30337.1 hypothetical protein [Falsiroseomonas selenitidurans]